MGTRSKKIFIPSGKSLYYSQIIAEEYARMLPNIRHLFERDDIFYRAIANRSVAIISSRKMEIPLIIDPSEGWADDEI